MDASFSVDCQNSFVAAYTSERNAAAVELLGATQFRRASGSPMRTEDSVWPFLGQHSLLVLVYTASFLDTLVSQTSFYKSFVVSEKY